MQNFSNLFPKRDVVLSMKQTYPEGSRVRLVHFSDPYRKLQAGLCGTVRCVDDIGTIHVLWDDGSMLGVALGEDECEIIKE